MSIRLKLLLSYIAMIFVPVALFVLAMMGLLIMLYSEKIGVDPPFKIESVERMKAYHARMEEQERHFSGLSYMFDYDPVLLEDRDYLRKIGDKLHAVNAVIIIEKEGQFTYVSPLVNSAVQSELLGKLGTEPKDEWSNPEFTLNDRDYSVSRESVTFQDGSAGEVYYVADITEFNGLIHFFFPIAALSLIGAVVLTNGVLTYFVSRSIIRPIKALKLAAEHIKEGDLDHPLQMKKRRDELGKLGGAFEEMRLRLKESIRVQLQVEEDRKALISSISHDLKTPITAIAGCADIMRDGIADTPEKQLKYINMIHRKAADMDRMIEELFLFSKLDLKKIPFHFLPVDLTAFLVDCTEELRLQNEAGTGDLEIAFEHPRGGPVFVMADREKLSRAIMNIVENSLKHMEKPARKLAFKLETGRTANSGGIVTVSIADNGPGIEREALPHIFERFYRADEARTSERGGSGLGLAIVKQIIEEHGGRVWADSVLGAGTVISFSLQIQNYDLPGGAQ
ncbi:sensor histidine kinase [Paenibacillus xanthanilyticus]|uniref:histidine kinase n=1 Tax=Paenibacillus xanthanilyticus TaxID=1783531 RepID=A0ABV8K642_9BACL